MTGRPFAPSIIDLLTGSVCYCESAGGDTYPFLGIGERRILVVEVETARGGDPAVADLADIEPGPPIGFTVAADSFALEARCCRSVYRLFNSGNT
ncbi:hypothetical protein M4D79_16340 [Mycolicibacterium novocastrense]|nr:hypothetical protein M4D79_16340 [Mycolicibacterium novocastrense]